MYMRIDTAGDHLTIPGIELASTFKPNAKRCNRLSGYAHIRHNGAIRRDDTPATHHEIDHA
jgi:hypothetical protein